MAKGMSLHIGLNQIDSAHYGTTGNLHGCENDARAMLSIAAAYGYKSTTLLTKSATAANVLKGVSNAAASLDAGDIFMLTYGGHGAQVPDLGTDEEDRLDETWCLYDRMLLDDELYRLWAQFRAGVRIIMVTDSCHNGTMMRTYQGHESAIRQLMKVSAHRLSDFRDLEQPVYRVLSPSFAFHAFNRFNNLYRDIKFSGARSKPLVATSVLLLAACQDNQTAADGGSNGRFTAELLDVWDKGRFIGNYKTFYNRIVSAMPPFQSPNYTTTGLANPAFEQESPFSITGKLPAIPEPVTNLKTSAPSTAGANSQPPVLEGVIPMLFTRTDIPPASDALVTVDFAGLLGICPGAENTCKIGVHRWTYSHMFQATLIVRRPNSLPSLVRLFNGPLTSAFLIRLHPDPGLGFLKAFAKTKDPFDRTDPNNDPRDYRWSVNMRQWHPDAGLNQGTDPGGMLKAGVIYTPTLTDDIVAPQLRRGEEVIPLYRLAASLAAAIEPPDGFQVRLEWEGMGGKESLDLPRKDEEEGTTYVISIMNDPPISYPEQHDELEQYYKVLTVGDKLVPIDDQWRLEYGRTTDRIPCMPILLEG